MGGISEFVVSLDIGVKGIAFQVFPDCEDVFVWYLTFHDGVVLKVFQGVLVLLKCFGDTTVGVARAFDMVEVAN